MLREISIRRKTSATYSAPVAPGRSGAPCQRTARSDHGGLDAAHGAKHVSKSRQLDSEADRVLPGNVSRVIRTSATGSGNPAAFIRLCQGTRDQTSLVTPLGQQHQLKSAGWQNRLLPSDQTALVTAALLPATTLRPLDGTGLLERAATATGSLHCVPISAWQRPADEANGLDGQRGGGFPRQREDTRVWKAFATTPGREGLLRHVHVIDRSSACVPCSDGCRLRRG